MKSPPIKVLAALGVLLILAAWPARTRPARSAPPTASLGTISGRVTLDDGRPAVGYSVLARSTRYVTSSPAGEAVTDADGQYRLSIDTGLSPSVFQGEPSPPADTQFTVSVQGQEPLYLVPPNQAVTLPADLTLTGVNFRLTFGPQITVHIHDALTGQPIAGVTAKYLLNRGINNEYTTAGTTDAQGKIIFRVPKLEVSLDLVPPGGDTPTLRAAPGSNFYREVILPQVQDVVWDVETEPLTPPTTPTVWHGVVLTQEGRPAAGAKVSILRSGAEAATVTDRTGHFTASLPPLTPEEYSSTYRGAAILAERGDQTAVIVPEPNAVWAGITVRLTRKPLASYAGTVIGPDGSPEAGVPVSCRGGLEIAPNSGAGVIRFGMTDALGRFLLPGLPAGRYQVNLGGGPFGPVTLPPSDPGYPYSSTILTLHDGEQHDFGRLMVPPADEVLAGQIVDHDGKPVTAGITAIVHGAHTSKTVDLDEEGQFRTYHIVREALTLDLYRANKDGGMQLGQTSPDLFLKVPVQAGRQDVRVVLPVGALPPPAVPVTAPPPPAAPPPVPVPVGPPQVSGGSGGQFVGGLLLVYYSWPPAPNPQQASIHALFENQFWAQKGNKVWEGSLADMDGMQLNVAKNHGTLKDRAGHELWDGPFSPEPVRTSYTVLTDKAKPNYLTLQDPQGKTLWSGLAASKVPAVVFVDGYVAVVGPNGRIVWQQPASVNSVGYQTLTRGRELGPNSEPYWIGFGPPFEGDIHFAVAPHRAVVTTEGGKVIYSGPLLTLTLNAMGDRKTRGILNGTALHVICPFTVGNYRGAVTYTLYDAKGRVVQSSTTTISQ